MALLLLFPLLLLLLLLLLSEKSLAIEVEADRVTERV